jgi:hypothetical protein
MTGMEAELHLNDLCTERGWDFGIRAETGSGCAWSAEVRVTRQPYRKDGPERSLVTFSAGAATPDEAVATAIADIMEWLGDD